MAHSSPPPFRLAATGIALALLGAASDAQAQRPYVDPQLYSSIRPEFSGTLPLCVLSQSATLEQDRQVAEDLAELLLLDSVVVELDIDMDQLDAQGIWPDLLIALSEQCLGIMGVQLIAGAQVPDWLTITQPYLAAPYVLVAANEDIGAIADLPEGARVGSPLYTPLDRDLLFLIDSGRDLMRLPYDTASLAADLMRSGQMDAAIIWQPHLDGAAFRRADFYASVGTIAPLQSAERSVGIVLRVQDAGLRTILDEAIAAL